MASTHTHTHQKPDIEKLVTYATILAVACAAGVVAYYVYTRVRENSARGGSRPTPPTNGPAAPAPKPDDPGEEDS